MIDAGCLALREVAVRDSIECQMQFTDQRRRKDVRLAQSGVLRAARNMEAVTRHRGVSGRSGEGVEQVVIHEAIACEEFVGWPEGVVQASVEMVHARGERRGGYEIRSGHVAGGVRVG